MIGLILVILVVLWFLGYISIPGLPFLNITLFDINGRAITLWDLLIFAAIAWALGILPSPLREIGVVLLILWVLSTLGIIAIAGLSSIIVIAVILGLVLSLLGVL